APNLHHLRPTGGSRRGVTPAPTSSPGSPCEPNVPPDRRPLPSPTKGKRQRATKKSPLALRKDVGSGSQRLSQAPPQRLQVAYGLKTATPLESMLQESLKEIMGGDGIEPPTSWV